MDRGRYFIFWPKMHNMQLMQFKSIFRHMGKIVLTNVCKKLMKTLMPEFQCLSSPYYNTQWISLLYRQVQKWNRSSQTTVIDIKTTALKNSIEWHWSHTSE